MVICENKRRLTEFGVYVKQKLIELNWHEVDLVAPLKNKGFVMYRSKLSALLHGYYNDKGGKIQKCILEILENAEKRRVKMVRMRTVKEAFNEIKKADPDSAISERAIRRIVKQQRIPIVPVGRKNLFSLDKLIDYLNNPDKYKKSDDEVTRYGTIRPVYTRQYRR